MSKQSDSRGTWNRRQVIAALGAAGMLGASGSATADETNVGGGPMSSEISHLNLEWYEGPESDLPSPGVEGRYYRVTSGGALWNTGDVLEDTGDQWQKIDIGAKNGNFESLDTEKTESGEVDTKKLTGGWSLNVEGPYSAQRIDYIVDERLQAMSQVNCVNWGHNHPTIFQDDTEDRIFATTPQGTIEKVGTVGATSGDGPQFSIPTIRDDWLIIQGTGSEPHTAYLYDSSADIDDDTTAIASQTDVWTPRHFDALSIRDTNTGNVKVLWAEYGSGAGTWNVWKASPANSSITSVLSNSNIDHFHNLEHDPYNHGTLYVTSGDGTDQRYWWKSTDFGETWSMLSVGDNQSGQDPRKWKTVRFAFGPDYIYWGTDGNVNDNYPNSPTEASDNVPRLYRAPRNDLSNPEEILKYSDTPYGDYGTGPRLLVYGLAYVENPRGILITHQETEGNIDKIPLFFWDINEEKIRRVYEIPTEGSSSLRGCPHMAPYPDNNTGQIYGNFNDYQTWRDGPQTSRGWSTFAAHGLSFQHMME